VTLLSNVHFHDDVHDVVSHLKAGASSRKYIKQFIDKFSEIFSPEVLLTNEQLDAAKSKFSLMPNVQYMGNTLEAFADAARSAIWKHSEIDLHRHEVDEIANSLVSLVESKSCAQIQGLSKEKIDLVAGVGLDDLLKILSISTDVYKNLLAGDDPAAIKTASILQRQLKAAGAPDVSWDVWLRTARHTFPDFDLDVLLNEIDSKCKDWLLSGGRLTDLSGVIDQLHKSTIGRRFTSLNVNLLFGGFCASIVRKAAK
jgi:hypothetical protein